MEHQVIPSSLLRKRIDEALAAMSYPAEPAGLYEPIRYVLSLGGKRLRPTLLLLAYNLYRDDAEAAMPAALGIETYHNYTLLHDDLMDRADLRRGHPTVHRRWNDNTAILSGDTMLVLAYRLFLQLKGSSVRNVLSLFTRTAVEIGEGQQMDMNFERRSDVSEAEYIEMIRLKTSVLLACALECGAMLAGAPADDAHKLYSAGEKIGLAFQLQDDLLDVYGDPLVFGKKIGGDILCNKKTFLLIRARNMASADELKELDRWQKVDVCNNPQQKIQAVKAIYDNTGVARYASEMIETYFSQGLDDIAQVNLPQERKAELVAYVSSLVHRKY